MQFRPCIDIHNGKVKQIVGGTLKDEGDYARENFVSEKGADYYADLYRRYGLRGGHIILLNGKDSGYYEATKEEALKGLAAYPGGMQIGGGITDENAEYFIRNGASHVIVTSYLFVNGRIDFDRLRKLAGTVGREHVVVDLSCRHYDDGYHIMTDRWQTKTDEILDFRRGEDPRHGKEPDRSQGFSTVLTGILHFIAGLEIDHRLVAGQGLITRRALRFLGG